MLKPEEILKKYWNYDKFRPLQKEIIDNIIAGHNTLALLPTGGGKSICFQVPGLMFDGMCIVVSPLIALMKDQVEQLTKRGILAAAIYSGQSNFDINQILDDAIDGKLKFLYLSPERLKTETFIQRVPYLKVGLLAIDEAHCISKWGYDFRPAYLKISEFRDLIPETPVIALTATATLKVRKDIIEKLDMFKAKVFVKTFARDNLSYSVFETDSKESRLVQILQKINGSAIVYTKTRNRTMEFAKILNKNGVNADYYHAGLGIKDRNKKQEDWVKNTTRVMVSTNAFGMGIDKPDVRCVVHVDLCENLEAYYQESGRAGRDEKKAWAVQLYNTNDIENIENNLDQKYPDYEFLKTIYQKLINYYQLAFGSKTENSFDFDLHSFATVFGLNVFNTHYALKLIESQGIIYLNDGYHSPPKLKINAVSNQLSDFLDQNKGYDFFVKTILRIYGGEIFSSYININEGEIASALVQSRDKVMQTIQKLHELKIFDFVPQKNKSQLGFLTEIQDAQKLSLNYKELDERKNNEKRALRAMKNFVLQNSKCRMQFIQDYFDETETKSCKQCDVCLKREKIGLDLTAHDEIIKKVKEFLPQNIGIIQHRMSEIDEEVLKRSLRNALHTGVLKMDSLGLIYSND
jgi:ATP-dependent DNA helicase RecQ